MISDLELELECKYCDHTEKVYVDEPDYNACHNVGINSFHLTEMKRRNNNV